MERLPTEIIDLIVSEIQTSSQRLSGLATISRAWQSPIERHTFQSLNLKSTELEQFADYLKEHRRRHLRRIQLTIILPSYPDSEHAVFENETDRDKNDAAFSEAIHGLFGTLKSWETDGSLELHIEDIRSPSDCSRHNDNPILSWEQVIRYNGNFYMRYRYSYINLLRAAELPVVQCIHHLEVKLISWLYRKLAAQCPMDLAAKLPNLQTLRAKVADSELTYSALRQYNRDGLGEALLACEPSTAMRDLDLDLSHRRIDNQHFQVPRLVSGEEEEAVDRISQGISAATKRMTNLASLRVRGVIDESLFRPATSAPAEPFWQNLTTLHVTFDMESPSGKWYFRSPEPVSLDDFAAGQMSRPSRMPETLPGYGSSPHEIAIDSAAYGFKHEFTNSGRWLVRAFRLVPDDAVLLPLVESFAGACAQIPGLKTAALATALIDGVVVSESGFRKNVASNWGVYFAAPGSRSAWWLDLQRDDPEEDDVPEEDLGRARLTLNTRHWLPDEKTLRMLRAIPTGGASLEEKHVDLWETVEKLRHVNAPPENVRQKVARFHRFFLDPVVDPDHFWKTSSNY